MARDQKLNVDITATDKASAKITDVAKKVDQLDGETADVKVEADTTGFLEGLKGLNPALDGVIGKVGDIAGKGGGLAGASGIAAIGAGLFTAIDHASDLAVEVDNLRTLTGDTAEDASRLNGVWKQAGFDAKDLQDVVLQMNGVLATSPELAEQLGINLDDGRTVGQRFLQVVEKMGTEFEDSAERSQVASQLFGEEGVRQVNAVQNAFGDLSDAVDNYNGKIWTQDQIARARDHQARVREVKQEWENLWLSASDAGFGLIDATERFFGAYASMGEDVRALFDGGEAKSNNERVRAWEDAASAVEGFDRALLANVKTGDEARAVAARYTDDLTAQNIIVAEWGRTHATAKEEVDDTTSAVDGLRAQGDRYVETLMAAGEEQRTVNERLRQSKEDADDASYAIQRLDGSWDTLRGNIEGAKTWLQLQEQFDGVQTAAEEAWTAAADGAEDAEQKSRDYQIATLDLKTAVGDYAKEVLNLPDEVISRLITQIDQGKKAEVEAFLARLGDGVTLPVKPQIIGGTRIRMDENGNLRQFARGTQHAPAGYAIVGEEGPELVKFGGGEKVFSANQTQGMVGGVTINIDKALVGEAEMVRAVGKALRMARYG